MTITGILADGGLSAVFRRYAYAGYHSASPTALLMAAVLWLFSSVQMLVLFLICNQYYIADMKYIRYRYSDNLDDLRYVATEKYFSVTMTNVVT